MGNFGVDDDFEMTRVKLEELIMDKIKTSMQITEGAIRSGNLTVEQIDEVLYYVPLFFSLLIPNISKVLLVGGSSKIPLISELLIN